ncbi:DUF3846 domain-containing protein [Spirosoma sordidisoli]|uniref:DUF3846 domain-containing protein n=1 Tax=Spirosoma sordidisoli TaxID=2502893 RepID=A0A4Q2UCD6_9BACT|nr:hypothetical protein [Spirosoma sordidisoli]RYC66494.1 hypothetical protein EQG79_29425 [Spirosoma sordidisoli]
MSKLTKVISIDPTRQVVEEIELDVNNLRALYEHIGCRTIDVVCRQPNGDALTVDDEALLVEPQPPAFEFEGFSGSIHGIAIVSGCNRNGRSTAPKMTVEEVREKVKFIGDVYTEPFLMVVSFDWP